MSSPAASSPPSSTSAPHSSRLVGLPHGTQIGTPSAAVAGASRILALPVSRAYVGLNDLAIDRGRTNIFEAVTDGTVTEVRDACTVPFGFGGLTSPDAGDPIPCRLLIGEMARVSTDFSFLRRSFHRDARNRPLEVIVPRLLDALAAARTRTPDAIRRDHDELVAAVDKMTTAAEASLLDSRGVA